MTAPDASGWKARIKRLPLLGTLLRWTGNHLRLNAHLHQINQQLEELRTWQRNLHALIETHDTRLEQIRADATALRAHIDALFDAADKRLWQLEAAKAAARLQDLEALHIGARLEAFDRVNIAHRLDKLDSLRLEERLNRTEQLGQERDSRMAVLLQSLASVAPASGATTTDEAKPAQVLPALSANERFYLEFENAFRGAPEVIRERIKVYLPYVRACAGDSGAEVVDIGCGRGEWLQLLREEGLQARGIDLNGAMVEACRAKGLQADCVDAIVWLRQQPPASLAAVTAFHVIEHLAFDDMLAFFDAALQALRPDGMLICETPNPENLVVAAHHFYYDPTHRHPIVPAVAEFTARQRGFARAEILRLHPYPDSFMLAEDSELARRFNQAFYSAQDFALLAWKSHAG